MTRHEFTPAEQLAHDMKFTSLETALHLARAWDPKRGARAVFIVDHFVPYMASGGFSSKHFTTRPECEAWMAAEAARYQAVATAKIAAIEDAFAVIAILGA